MRKWEFWQQKVNAIKASKSNGASNVTNNSNVNNNKAGGTTTDPSAASQSSSMSSLYISQIHNGSQVVADDILDATITGEGGMSDSMADCDNEDENECESEAGNINNQNNDSHNVEQHDDVETHDAETAAQHDEGECTNITAPVDLTTVDDTAATLPLGVDDEIHQPIVIDDPVYPTPVVPTSSPSFPGDSRKHRRESYGLRALLENDPISETPDTQNAVSVEGLPHTATRSSGRKSADVMPPRSKKQQKQQQQQKLTPAEQALVPRHLDERLFAKQAKQQDAELNKVQPGTHTRSAGKSKTTKTIRRQRNFG